jgi:hypothetical protein
VDGQLVLTLRLVGWSGGRYALEVSVRNVSNRPLLVPEPLVIGPRGSGLQFRRVDDGTETEWFASSLELWTWRGGVLGAGDGREYPLSVAVGDGRALETDEPVRVDDDDRWSDDDDPWEDGGDRWVVDLRPGAYDVMYRLRVGEDYFDPDSHTRMPKLRTMAATQGAEVWTGDVASNGVRIVHP